MSELTRAELVTLMRDRRVVVDSVRGGKARITIDYGGRSTIDTVPEDWIKPMLEGRAAP